MMKHRISTSLITLCILLSGCNRGNTINITRYGAKGDGKTLNTVSIQKAIDKAATLKGATVVIPPGVFMSGTLFLKKGITLYLAAGATLLGSPDIKHYTPLTWGHNRDRQPYHLLYCDSISDLVIDGQGTIDGNGEAFWQEYEKDSEGKMVTPRWIKAKDQKVSPLIDLCNSSRITISGITVKTGGGWNINLLNCEQVKINGINIINNLYSPNSDGIDITGCSDVMVSNCYIKTCDDAICLKTTPDSRECRRIAVTNCILETLCVGLKMGCNESFKDMSDVVFSNCVVNQSSRAVGLYIKEGATYTNIVISNITANTNAPLVLNRPIQLQVIRNKSGQTGRISNVTISNFTCNTQGRILLTAEKGCVIENVVLRDIILNYPMIEDPGLYGSDARSGQYPDPREHPEAVIAAAAVVADNIQNLVIDNLIINWPQTTTIPAEWNHPEKIENGSTRIHKITNNKTRQTEFSVLWGKELQNGYIFTPLSQASANHLKKYILTNSTIKINEKK